MPQDPQTRGWTIGHLFGGRVVLQPSSLVMILILAFLWGTGGDGQITGQGFARGGALALLLFASIFLHEMAHAFAARAYHRKVEAIVITLWGGHTHFDAKDMTPKISGVTAAAGPLMNAVLALASWGALHLPLSDGAATALGWLTYANLALAIFNALPGIPMDGGRVLEAVIWAATGNRMLGMKVAAWGGRVVALAYLGWVLRNALAAGGQGERPSLMPILWGFFLFSLLWPAAGQALRVARIMERVEASTAIRTMRPAIGVPHTATVAAALREAERAEALEVVVLSEDGVGAGHFSVETAQGVPEAKRSATSLSAVTIPIPRGTELPPGATGQEVLAHAREWWGRTDAIVVADEGTVVGVILLAELSARLG